MPSIAAVGSGIFVVSWQDQQTGANAHVFTASSIDSGASWTVTQTQLDTGTGAAVGPKVTPALQSGKPTGVTAWTDFRTNHTKGDIFASASHN